MKHQKPMSLKNTDIQSAICLHICYEASSRISFVQPSSSLWILVTALFYNMETTLDSMISYLYLKVYMLFDRKLKEYFAWSLLKWNINASLSLAHISWLISGTMAINYRKCTPICDLEHVKFVSPLSLEWKFIYRWNRIW